MSRLPSVLVLLGVLCFASAASYPGSTSAPNPDLFVSAGCSTCHGDAAAGAFGPTLAGTDLTFDAFLAQLRSPRGVMPPVASDLVSDEQARELFDFVSGLTVPEGGPISGTACCGRGCGHGTHHAGAGAGRGHHGQRHGRGHACQQGRCKGRLGS